MFAMLMGSMFLLPVFMQELMGFDATQSGIVLMPRTLAMMVVTPIVGKLYNHVPPAIVVAVGALLFVLGSYQLSHITLASSSADIMIPLVVTGAGLACLFVPLTTAALTFIPRGSLADASGLNSFVRQIGGSLGLTIFATLLGRYQTRAGASLAENVTNVRPEAVDRLSTFAHGAMARGQDAISAQHVALAAVSGSVKLQAAVLAFEKTFLLQAAAFVIVLPLLFFLRVSEKRSPGEHIEIGIE
jgi:DHA2 family multidrug resistance protein